MKLWSGLTGVRAGREVVGETFTDVLFGDTDLELIRRRHFCSLRATRALGEGGVESSETTIGEV
jgi:hypothetical protein